MTLKKFLPFVFTTIFISQLHAQLKEAMSDRITELCQRDHLPTHIYADRNRLMGKLLAVKKQLDDYELNSMGLDKYIRTYARRITDLDTIMESMKALEGNDACYVDSDCKFIGFDSYSSIPGRPFLPMIIPYSKLYTISINNEDTLIRMGKIFKKYVSLNRILRERAQAAGENIAPVYSVTQTGGIGEYSVSLCHNYKCVHGHERLPPLPGVDVNGDQVPFDPNKYIVDYSDGLTNYSKEKDRSYRTEKQFFPIE